MLIYVVTPTQIRFVFTTEDGPKMAKPEADDTQTCSNSYSALARVRMGSLVIPFHGTAEADAR